MAVNPVAMEVLGKNVTKVWVGDKTILFSYSTPIAAWVRGNGTVKRYEVRQGLSPTSKRHLNEHGPKAFLGEADHCEEVTAEKLDEILLL